MAQSLYLALLNPAFAAASSAPSTPIASPTAAAALTAPRRRYVSWVDGAVAPHALLRLHARLPGRRHHRGVRSSPPLFRRVRPPSAAKIRSSPRARPQFHGNRRKFRNSVSTPNPDCNHSPTSPNGGPPAFRFNQFGYDLSGPVFIPENLTGIRVGFLPLGPGWIRRRRKQNPTAWSPRWRCQW